MEAKRICRREFFTWAGAASGATLLAACRPVVTPTEPATVAPTVAPDATPVAPAPVTERVRVEFFGAPGAEGWLDQFHEEHPDLEYFQIENIEGMASNEQLLSLVAAGTPPDCARVESSFYRTFAHYGLLLPITENIQADPEFSKPDYWIQPQESDRCVYRGEWYGIGSCWVAPHFYYNLDILEELGVEPPSNDPEEAWDWDQFLDMARQLTVDVNGRHPGETGFDETEIDRWGVSWPTWWIPLHAAVQSNGAAWVDDEGKIVLDAPEAMEALQRISDLMFVHRVMPKAEAMEALGMAGAQLLETGKVVLVVDGSWALNWLWEIEGTLGTAVLPKMMRPATDMQAHLVTIMKATKQPDNAWRLVRFLSSPFFQELNLQTGLWLPSQTALMTDAAIARWCQPPVHPPGYELIVTEYTPKHGHYLTMPVGYLKAADSALQPAFDELFAARARAEEVLPEAVANANRIMEEEQARPTLQ